VTEALADGWGTSTPRDDSLTRMYVEAFGDMIEEFGTAIGLRTLRSDAFVAYDSQVPNPWQNVAVLLRPIVDARDTALDEIGAFFADDDEHTPFLLMSATHTPSLADRGWTLLGHPPLMLRPPGQAEVPTPDGLEIIDVRDPETLATFNETMIAAFPVPELQGRPGYPPPILDVGDYRMWLGMLDGEPVGTSAAHVTDGFVDVEWISVMPAARGRRVGEAMTWTATLANPELPAMLIASDLGQPVYERMGYVRLSRFTLWAGVRS
jgi:hypothetical protein